LKFRLHQRIRLGGSLLGWLLCCAAAHTHEIRPASVEITETPDTTQVVWRQPVIGEYAIALAPQLSSGWLDAAPTQQSVTPQTLSRTWRMDHPQEVLRGQTLTVIGLDRTLTDVFVRVHWRNGDETTALLKPLQPSMVLSPQNGSGAAIRQYFQLGLAHIASGYDHLLYLLGLMLLVGNLRALIGVITAFTAAHSLTLALSMLGLVKLQPAPVEAAIALSIVLVAAELRRGQLGEASFTHRYPWVVAFLFGLLHGFGFAGALRSMGLPDGAIAMPMLLFNLGIEAGQIFFVAAASALLWLLARQTPRLHGAVLRGLPFAVGGFAAWWLLERVAAMGSAA
jgi:hypothetical protein